MNFVKRGKQECPKCKTMRETVIENIETEKGKLKSKMNKLQYLENGKIIVESLL